MSKRKEERRGGVAFEVTRAGGGARERGGGFGSGFAVLVGLMIGETNVRPAPRWLNH